MNGFSDHLPFSYGKAGTGAYGNNMGQQELSELNVSMAKILSAVESITVEDTDKRLFTIADYGAADGFVSIPILTELIEFIRKKHGEIPIQIVYEDQASNDFNSLFRRVHGLISDPPTYLKRFSQVYPMASGMSFFDQVLPDDSTHFIMSFRAAHYLSELPTKFQNCFHRFPDATEAERQLVEVQAAKDWETFLWHRAKELKSGGVLIVSTCADILNGASNGARHELQGTEEALVKIWRQMRDEGTITKEEFVDTNMPRCTRYLHELTAPLENRDSRVYQAGLRLFRSEVMYTPCVHKKEWQRKLGEEGVDTRQSWAHTVMNQHRVWTNHFFLQGLSSTRTPRDKDVVVNELYERLQKEIFDQGPNNFENGTLINYVYVRKV